MAPSISPWRAELPASSWPVKGGSPARGCAPTVVPGAAVQVRCVVVHEQAVAVAMPAGRGENLGMSDDEPEEPRRQVARRERRDAGDRSARLAKALMKLPESALGKLGLEEELREALGRARAVTSPIARRRAERALAGELRGADLADIEGRLANVQAGGAAETRLFKLAERWRARLIEEGSAAAAEFPGGGEESLRKLIQEARRERETGRPPGAARALFRHVVAVLKAQDSERATSPDATEHVTDDDSS
jgi:ribosome-associated protein